MRIRFSFGSRHTGKLENIRKQRQKFPKLLKDVVEQGDLILEVIDARFVDKMRNDEVEALIEEKSKKLIYILNKSDLVDVEETKKSPSMEKLKPFMFISVKTGQGGADLRRVLKIEAKRFLKEHPELKQMRVGVIGYPNVGKSSLINFITRRGAAKTAQRAGFTKGLQKIKFTPEIVFWDSPGVIPDTAYSTDDKSKQSVDAILNARSYSDIKNPEAVVWELMKSHADKLEKFYKIKAEGDSEVLIEELGKKKNFILKGKSVDIDRTTRLIIRDWQEGRMK